MTNPTKTKRLTFYRQSDKYHYTVLHKRTLLGQIYYEKKWKCIVFQNLYEDSIYSVDCLRQIADFIDNLEMKL